jgi:HEAT repeat protein
LLKTKCERQSEFELFMGIANAARTVEGATSVGEVVRVLERYSRDSRFLVRDSVVNAVSRLCTRSDVEDSWINPYKEQLRSILDAMLTDESAYVRQSAIIATSLVDGCL